MNRLMVVLAACVIVVGAGYANGAVVFLDNFDSENGGNYALNYTGFANWNVVSGSVDLIGEGSPWNFFPGHGLYVDMDGSTFSQGTMVSVALPLEAGSYLLSYDLAGSQRSGPDSVTATVEVGVAGPHVINLAWDAPFATYSDSFVLATPEIVNIQFAASSPDSDNIGLLLDNVKLESVPEPATILVWSLLGAMSWLGMRVWRGGQRICRRAWSPESRQAILEIASRRESR